MKTILQLQNTKIGDISTYPVGGILCMGNFGDIGGEKGFERPVGWYFWTRLGGAAGRTHPDHKPLIFNFLQT